MAENRSSIFGFFDAVSTAMQNLHSVFFPGLMVIFSHENFNDPSLRRFESASDVLALQTLFANLNYTVEIKNDQCLHEITLEINKLRNMDFNKFKCLVIVILTHGTVCGTLRAFDEDYLFQQTIVDKIVENPTLEGVPKIFITNVAVSRIKAKMVRSENSRNFINYERSSRLEADVIKIYNNYIFRSRNQPNLNNFIKFFCEIINRDKDKNIDDVLLECRRLLIQSYSSFLPIETTTMTNKFSFPYGKVKNN